jgi:hypothetical protein
MDPSLSHAQHPLSATMVQHNMETSGPARVRLSRTQIETTMKHVVLVSIFRDPASGCFQHLRQDRLNLDKDYDIVENMLNPRVATGETTAYRPRIDLFLVYVSLQGGRIDMLDIDESDAEEIISRRKAAGLTMGQLGMRYEVLPFKAAVQVDKMSPMGTLLGDPPRGTAPP